MNKPNIKNDLKKAIHRAISKAYMAGNGSVKKAVDGIKAQHIIADIEDPDFKAAAPHLHTPASSQSVLHKDSQQPPQKALHEVREAEAKASMGMRKEIADIHMSEKAPRPLKSFMAKKEEKRKATSK